MNTEYNTVYGQFEKIFKEQAESFIPEDDIKITLKMEKIRFENAEKYNISINGLSKHSNTHSSYYKHRTGCGTKTTHFKSITLRNFSAFK